MKKVIDVYISICVCVLSIQPLIVYSSEKLLEADIDTRVEYNDNIFLTDGPHDSVTGITITPSLSGVYKEQNWEVDLSAMLRISKYSDHTIDGNDQFFDLTGQYNEERNIFSLNINHDLDSNLSSTSTDFGIAGKRIDRKSQSITPRYTRLITERLFLSVSYTYTDVDFLEVDNGGLVPFIAETGSASLNYDLTEDDGLSINLQAVDYRSKDDLQTFKLFTTSVGIDHKFSDILSFDLLIGVSRRQSTNRNPQSFDFFGQTLVRNLVIDSTDRGFVLDAGITQRLLSGEVSGRISRDNTTNSFGGLDKTDIIKVNYDEKISSLWRYIVSARIEDITSINSGTSVADRDVLFFETIAFYTLNRNWYANASYRYTQRKFKSDTSDNRAPHSNRVYIGLTYNLPPLSTF